MKSTSGCSPEKGRCAPKQREETMAETSGQSTWKIDINVAGVAPLKPGGPMIRVDDGAYQGKLVEALLVPKKGDNAKFNVMFVLQHLDTNSGADGASYKNRQHRVYIPVRPLLTNVEIAALSEVDRKAYNFNQQQWRTVLESIGAQPEKLDASPVCSVSSDLFAGGRGCFFVIQNPPEGELTEDGKKKYENANFCNAAHFKKLREAAALSGTASTSGVQMQAPVLQTQQPAALGNLGSLLGTAAPAGGAAGNGVPALRL